MPGQHHINKFVIRCVASEQTGMDAVRAIASTQDKIIAVISNLLDQYAPIPETITIKKLHLDLGRLYVHEVPTKLKDRLSSMLEAELKAFFDRNEVRAYLQQERSATPDLFELIYRYLRQGFNEHLQQDRTFDVERLMLELLTRDPQKLASALSQAWSHGHARKRLQQVSPATRTALGEVFPATVAATYSRVEVSGSHLTILTHYYSTGYFPESAALLRPGDLEALVVLALRDDRQKLAMHIYKGLHQPDFLQRLAETLTVTTLKEVVTAIPQLNHAWQLWQVLSNAMVTRVGLPPALLHFTPGKAALLRFIIAQHPQARAGVWLHYMTQEAPLAPAGSSMNAYLRDLAEHVQHEALPGLSDLVRYVQAAARDAKSSAPEEVADDKERALKHAAHYLSYGVVSREYTNAAQLFDSVFSSYAHDLKTLITARWGDAVVRHRLAWHTAVPQLQAITRLVWQDHASYGRWKILRDTLQQYGTGYEPLVREAYARYYDYLAAYGHTSWPEAPFTSWMKAGLAARPEARDLFLPSINPAPSLKKAVPLRRKGSGADEDRVLALVRYYYHTGRFPGNAGSLRHSDLELLVHRLLQVHAEAFLHYFRQQLPHRLFATRLSETLSFSTLKHIVGRMDSFGLALREWLAWEEWLQATALSPAPVTPHAKMLFLQYVTQVAPAARLQTAREYLRIAWSLQEYRLTFRDWLKDLQQQQDLRTTPHDTTAAFVEQLLQAEPVAGALERLPAPGDERMGMLERHLTGTEPNASPVSVNALLQSLIDEEADALATFLRAGWQDPAIRAGLVQQAEAQVLEAVTALVWKEHGSYTAWRSFYAAVQTAAARRGESTSAQVTRLLYHHYFEFLAAHPRGAHEQYFREWMYTNLREVLPHAAAFFGLEAEDRGLQEEEDTSLWQHAPEQPITPAEALNLVTHYYRHGQMPQDSRLHSMHLEWLVNKSMERHSPEVMRYVTEHLSDEAVATRLSETLSLPLLEKIIIDGPSWQQAFTSWQIVQAAFDAAGLLRWLPLHTRKRSLLVFVGQSSPAARAQSLLENLPPGAAVDEVLEKLIGALSGSPLADAVLEETLLKEIRLRREPSPRRVLPGLPGAMGVDNGSSREGIGILQGGTTGTTDTPAEAITDTAALELVKYYYQRGQFPEGSSLGEARLEWLVSKSMERHSQEVAQFVFTQLNESSFAARLSETLSPELLEKIVAQQSPGQQALMVWKALQRALEAAGLLQWTSPQTRSRSLLAFVSQSSPAAQAQALVEFLPPGAVSYGMLDNIREVLRREVAVDRALQEALLKEVSLRMASMPAEAITATVALELVAYYYEHRQFPHGSPLNTVHLEWLIHRAMEQHRAAYVQYMTSHVAETAFVLRLAETMSWDLLEKIAKAHEPWMQSYEAWQAMLETLAERRWLPSFSGLQRKIFMLEYIVAPSIAEKAQVASRYLRLPENISVSALGHVRESLRDKALPGAVTQEVSLVMDALEKVLHKADDQQATEVEAQPGEGLQPVQLQDLRIEALMDFLLRGILRASSREDMPTLMAKLLNTDAGALVTRLRSHWSHQPLRYRLTLLGRDVLEKVTQLLWGTHASYTLWNTWVGSLSPQPDDTLRSALYLVYFNELQEHGDRWHETHFRDRMVMALREYKHRIGDVEAFRNNVVSPEVMPQRLRQMLQGELQPFVSNYYGRPSTPEDIQRFWDGLTLQNETWFTAWRGLPVKDAFWTELTHTLTTVQLRHVLYHLASFQFGHLDHLRAELQHFISRQATASETGHVVRTWYKALFITLHKQGSTIGKNEAARLAVQQVFQEHSWINAEERLRHDKAEGIDVQQQFPALTHILITLWPGLASEYLKDAPSLVTPAGVSSDTQNNNEGSDRPAVAAPIKRDFASVYDTVDLIIYYLKTGGFPSWSTIQTTAGLREVAERLIAMAPAAKLEELRHYPLEPDMDRRLKDLLSPAARTKLLGVTTEDESPARGSEPMPMKYSADVVLERQRIELLLHVWVFQEVPWWITSCDGAVEQDHALDESLLKDQVLQQHLEALLSRMRQSPAEWRLVEKLMADVSLSIFYKIIAARFPVVSGFVVSTFTLLNDAMAAKDITLDVEASSLYTFVYRLLLAQVDNFSSRTFVHQMFYFLWPDARERQGAAEALSHKAEAWRSAGDTRFWVISELLKEPGLLAQAEDERQPAQPPPVPGVKHDDHWFGEALISYIRFGTIPAYTTDTRFTRQQLLDRLRQDSPSARLLIKSLFSNLAVLQAFIQRADPEVVDAILALLSADRYAEFASWKTGWVKFTSWALNYPVADMEKIALKTLFVLLQRKAEFAVTGVVYLRSAFENLFREQKTASLEVLAEKMQAYKASTEELGDFIRILEETVVFLLENERFKLMQSLLNPKAQSPAVELVKLEGRLPVQNAGIVILGPFLYRYFSKLGMLEGNKFKSEEMAWRAVHLLQFLVSGKTEVPGHAMVLNKILCGVEINTPIDTSIELTAEEREVSESLLQGVLENWDKLKTRSIDALREGFLMRDGYLEETEMGWTLEVDRKAMDILVDFIPWSFSMIKLAWMQKSLATTWQSSEYRDLMR